VRIRRTRPAAVLAAGLILLTVSSPTAAKSETSTASPGGAVLVILINPSARVHELAFRHAQQLVAALTKPNLTVVAGYEQRGADDGPPFDQPLLATQSPSPPGHVTCSGTKYQKGICRDHARKRTEAFAGKLASWKKKTIGTLASIAARNDTEESPTGVWNLHAGLERSGQVFAATPGANHCVVLLGGLASSAPKPDVTAELLSGATLVVSGSNGSPAVQALWQARLQQVEAKIVFVPIEVTELRLVPTVRACLDAKAAP
jgi:hypothetical protein